MVALCTIGQGVVPLIVQGSIDSLKVHEGINALGQNSNTTTKEVKTQMTRPPIRDHVKDHLLIPKNATPIIFDYQPTNTLRIDINSSLKSVSTWDY